MSKGKIGFYLTDHTERTIKMPSQKAQDMLNKVLGTLSDNDIFLAEELDEQQTKEEHSLNVKLTDEMLASLLRDMDFRKDYEAIGDEEQAHIWLLIYDMEILRTNQNNEYVKTFR